VAHNASFDERLITQVSESPHHTRVVWLTRPLDVVLRRPFVTAHPALAVFIQVNLNPNIHLIDCNFYPIFHYSLPLS
jgi:hypothetical protein